MSTRCNHNTIFVQFANIGNDKTVPTAAYMSTVGCPCFIWLMLFEQNKQFQEHTIKDSSIQPGRMQRYTASGEL